MSAIRGRPEVNVGAPGQKSGCDAYSPRDGRASVWYAEDADGATHFLMKTLPKVATEMALHVLAYNLTRVTNILGIKPLLAAIRA